MAATRRFRVRIITIGDGFGDYEYMRRATSPVDAVDKVMRQLSLDDLNQTAFSVFVEPVGPVRHN